MIHEAYMPVYIGSRFSLRTGARAGPPEVVQEALADLKMNNVSKLRRSNPFPLKARKSFLDSAR